MMNNADRFFCAKPGGCDVGRQRPTLLPQEPNDWSSRPKGVQRHATSLQAPQPTYKSCLLLLLHVFRGIKPAALIQINGAAIDPAPATEINLGTNVQHNNGRDRDIGRKEVLGSGLSSKRPDGEIELGNDQENAPEQSPPCRPWIGPRLPGELLTRTTLDQPGAAHSNVREADHTPSEQGEERRQVGEPSEHSLPGIGHIQVRQASSDEQGRDQGIPRTACTVCLLHNLCAQSVSVQPPRQEL